MSPVNFTRLSIVYYCNALLLSEGSVGFFKAFL
ncbi:Uncharacterised protein [Vibrio cholerae]|nr:Uncharacterised protein [Vibrio cholerae]